METGKLYYKLFSDYTPEQFDHSVTLVVNRLKKWNIDVRGKKCLDVGCGGGRNLVALKRLGAREIHGLDIDEKLVGLARERSVGGNVVVGDSIELPYADESFDFIICAGVAHHVRDPQKCLDEVYRVLRDGGQAYILLYKKHFYWDTVVFMRKVAKIIPFYVMQKILWFLPANRKYNIMDNWYVTYLNFYSEEEARMLLKKFVCRKVEDTSENINVRFVVTKQTSV
jgi:ubiquinone/menaquinone biosynthesis C-methylase UbiE